MSRQASPSTQRPFGIARVTRVWGVPRSTVYARRTRRDRPVLPGTPTIGHGRENDARTRQRIRSSVVVTERDAKLAADVGQLRRGDSPLRTRELHSTGERRPRRVQPVPGTTGAQDALVKRRIVGGDERRVVDPGAERRPQLGEGGRVAHVLPTETMEPRERELPGWRPDQVGPREHDPAAAAGRKADRAGAVAAGGGGLEVNSDEGAHGSCSVMNPNRMEA